MKKGKKKFKVIKDYESPYPSPIIFQLGETVKTSVEFNDYPEWKNWIRCHGLNDKEAWCPIQYLELSGDTGTFVQYYDAKELTIQKGDIILIGEEINGFGYAVKHYKETGWVPLNCLELL